MTPAIAMLEFGVLEHSQSHEPEAQVLVKQQEVLAEAQVAVFVHVAERFREFAFPIFAQVLERKPHPGRTRCRKRLYKT